MERLTEVNWDRELTEEMHWLAKAQAMLFEVCELDFKKDGQDFVEKFMNSDLALKLDKGHLYSEDYKELGKIFLDETPVKPLEGTKCFHVDVLFWMGYLYRYWASLGVPSKEIIKIAPFDKVLERYVWHTLDIIDVIEQFYKEYTNEQISTKP